MLDVNASSDSPVNSSATQFLQLKDHALMLSLSFAFLS